MFSCIITEMEIVDILCIIATKLKEGQDIC